MNAAVEILKKAIFPTHLDTAGIRAALAADIRRRSFFSATIARERYLERMRQVISDLLEGVWNDTKAKEVLQKELDALGYNPEAGGFPEDIGLEAPIPRGSIRDVSSLARVRLQLETQNRMARSLAQIKAGNSSFNRRNFPAWSLERLYARRIPRDWPARWAAAGDSVNWEGVAQNGPGFVALKDSPIWQALGDGAGGYEDTLGNPYPPFAFTSGLGWRPVSKADAEAMGLTGTPEAVEASLTPGEQEIADALQTFGPEKTMALVEALREMGGRAEMPEQAAGND